VKVVVDASPLCYLILIGEIDLLPSLFSRIVVPEAVLMELLHEDAPERVRQWAESPPDWVVVGATPVGQLLGMEKLQAGERAAILLAEYLPADLVIIDERAARQVAGARGLRVTGVLGVIGEAATKGLVDITQAIDRLRLTNFRCSPALFRAVLERYGPRAS
jgi:predicted nucleic acid-binding protein